MWWRRAGDGSARRVRDAIIVVVVTAILVFGSYGEGNPSSPSDRIQFLGHAAPQPGAALILVVIAGASGFLVKDTEPADLLQAVRVVARGDALLSPSVTRRLITDLATRPERPPPSDRVLAGLTEREREVLALVAEGLSNDEIAGRLFLSPLTAKTHVSRIMTKLNARDRAQLVVIAYESGLVTPGGRL